MAYNLPDSMNIGIYTGQPLPQNIMIAQHNPPGPSQAHGLVTRPSTATTSHYSHTNTPGYIMVPTNSLPPTTLKSSTTSSETKLMKPQILEKMRALRDRGKYCDVAIDVKGVRFHAHRNILAAWSPYFDCQLLSENHVMRDLLIVNYDSYEVFSDLLDFLYSGTIAPRETNFLQLLHLAVSFQIDLLKHYCEEFLRSNLHLGNFLSTYFLSRKYNLKSLEEFIVSFIQANLSDVVKQIEFLTLPADRFNAILSKGYMVDLKPEIKLFLIISWVGYEVRDRECFLIQLLRHIDWSIVASDFLLEISRTENFFTTHESSLYLLLQTLFSSGISLGPYTDHFPSLRQTYSHMLNDIVKAGLIDAYEEEFYPVTASGVCTKFLRSDACVGTDNYYHTTTEVEKTWEELRSVVFSPPTQQTSVYERQINDVEKENKLFYQSSKQQSNQAENRHVEEETKSSKRKGKPRKMVLAETPEKVQSRELSESVPVGPSFPHPPEPGSVSVMDFNDIALKYRSSVQYSALPEVTDDDEKDHEQFLQEVIYHDDPEPRPNTVTMTPGKSLSLIQIILLNAVVCGVEICACAGFTYIPPMLLKAGYTEENMSIILGMGPLLGFIFVPIIGRASDNCFSSWGRRRPFIVGISSILMFALITIPYSDWISLSLFGPGSMSKTGALLILTIGVVLLDFTSQACLTPCEALLSDASKDTNQQERVFMVYSQMVSLGGFLGYLITALDWNTTAIGALIGGQERTVFSLLVFLFMFLLFVTVAVANEEPHIVSKNSQAPDIKPVEVTPTTVVLAGPAMESGYESSDSDEASLPNVLRKPRSRSRRHKKKFRPIMLLCMPFVFILKRFRIFSYVQFYGRLVFAAIQDKLPESVKLLLDVPYVLRKLAVANFCSWTAVMGFNLFFTDFVGQAVYEGNPNAEENSYLRARYDEGVRMGSWGLLFHCITSALYAFFVENLVERYGIRRTYAAGMMTFTLSMGGMVLFRNIYFVNTMAALTGFGYATLTTIPFIIVTKYHSEKEIYFRTENGKNNFRGIGTDIATLDSAYFLSQVVLSGIMGYIVHLTGTVLSYMITAGVMGMLSCIFIQSIITSREEMIGLTKVGNSVINI